jgi:hypothetical protein
MAMARSEFATNVDNATAQALEKLSGLNQFHTRFAVHWIVAGILSMFVVFAAGLLLGMMLR